MPPKKGKRTKQTGKGLGDAVSKINKIAKDTKIISKALQTLAPDNSIAQGIAGAADQLGYGRKKKHTQRGGNFFDTVGGITGGIGHTLGSTVNRTLGGLFGGSRRPFARNPMMVR
jgi:hypothetical protein